MITSVQEDYIKDHAYVPEHIPTYVTAISQTEPFLLGDFLAYRGEDHLIFVGYPFKESFDEELMSMILGDAIKRLRPESVSLIAPTIPSSIESCSRPAADHYYRLDLSSFSISQKLRNMLNRAGRELSVTKNKIFDEEHKDMVEEFLRTHPVDEATRFIFRRIDQYLASSRTAWVFDAKNSRGELAAFDVAEFWAACYTVCMFSFSSDALFVPGASDLLLSEVNFSGGLETMKEIEECNVLIVDDEEAFRLFLEHFFKNKVPGIRIRLAKDGEEAYNLALKFRPRIIWTCVRMPRMSGLELIELIKKNQDLRSIKIIVYTAYYSEETKNQAFALGADAFLSKGDFGQLEKGLKMVADFLTVPKI
jgi:CheY-like chemotaxis protein